MGQAEIVSRSDSVVAGLAAIPTILDEMDTQLEFDSQIDDGDSVTNGQVIGSLRGSVRDLLVAERLVLNFLGRLSVVATLASKFVTEIDGTSARIYDTRKTTPGFRKLEKYAARCGGAHNHRTGLYSAILIKDNHLAFCGDSKGEFSPFDAVIQAKKFLSKTFPIEQVCNFIVEVEVDSLLQFDSVLPANPDIVLLDNMSVEELTEAVERRNQVAPKVSLEASGGVNLETVRDIAESGVDRISVGAITHSATNIDFGLDWRVN